MERAVAAAAAGTASFDLATQAASLIGALAVADNARAARAAKALLADHATWLRTMCEVVYALGFGTGPAMRLILE